MSDDPATEPVRQRRAALRRRQVIVAGHGGDIERARHGMYDPDPEVQAAAVHALGRCGALTVADIAHVLASDSAALRRRAGDATLTVRGRGARSHLFDLFVAALADPDPLVVVDAAWFLGERRVRAAVERLSTLALTHPDLRCREASVAALGAIGDPGGLAAVLAALEDKPTVRRRATVALAGFDDPRVEPAWRRSAEDRDWQVRQAAEELLSGLDR